ncbi:MAG: FAD-dependent oxidoreductase [Sulfolobaceae archaeon]|nr:FAD-dependent oxidoreductase [Sulfolobaceae archaeon]
MTEKLVVIGGGAAGMSGASRARRLNPSMQITVYEETKMVSHAPCGIPYYIEGLFSDEGLFMTYTPSFFKEKRNINVVTNFKVTEVDLQDRIIVAENGTDKIKDEYDYLLITTGAKPKKIKQLSFEGNRIFYIHHPAHATELKNKLLPLNKIAIIGGGILGVELAEALVKQNKKVILIQLPNYLLNKLLDEDMGKIITDYISKYVEVKTNERVEDIRNEGTLVITDKNKYEVDGVVISIGVEPNTDLFKDKLELGFAGTIKVNEYMQTSRKGVYAAGDVAEAINIITRKPDWQPFAPVANKMGFVAGSNIAGKAMKFPGVVGTTITKFNDMFIGKVGLTEADAKRFGIKTISSPVIKARTRARYYPGGGDIYVKLIAEEGTLRILGAEIIGYEEVLGRLNTIAAALYKGFTAEDLFFTEMGYLPAITQVWDPVIIATRYLLKAE